MHQSEQSLHRVMQVNSYTASLATQKKKGASTNKSTEKKKSLQLCQPATFLLKEREKGATSNCRGHQKKAQRSEHGAVQTEQGKKPPEWRGK